MRQLHVDHSYLQPPHHLIVRDIIGHEIYLIKGRWGRKSDHIELFSIEGDLLVKIKQKTLSLFPRFDIYDPRQKIATIQKHPGFLSLKPPYFTVKPLNWTISGNFEKRQYQIRSKTETLMTIQKVATSRGDHYYLFVYAENDEPLCVAISVIIDHWINEHQPQTLSDEDHNYQLGFLNFRLINPRKTYRSRLHQGQK